MGKGLGIAGFVVLLISFLIPIVGTYVTFLALVIVAIGALMGETAFAIATAAIAAVKVFLLSPTWIALLHTGPESNKRTILYVTLAFLAGTSGGCRYWRSDAQARHPGTEQDYSISLRSLSC